MLIKNKKFLSSHEGFAYLEIIPVLILMMLLLRYSVGFFGVIHTAILNTISARNYAFETFRHRSQLNYFRPRIGGRGIDKDKLSGNRFHGKYNENHINSGGDPNWWATVRSIGSAGNNPADGRNGTSANYHNNVIMNEPRLNPYKRYREDESGSDPVWIRQTYGICLDARCGD